MIFSRTTNTRKNITSTRGTKCNKKFIKNNEIDIDELKSSDIKLDNDTANYINEYKKAQKDFNKTSGWFDMGGKSGYSCNEYTKIINTNNKTKYSSKINNCNNYKDIMSKSKDKYIKSFIKYIKDKIKTKLIKVLKDPTENQMLKFSCYIQILFDLNSRLTIDNITNKFLSLYNEKDDIKNGAKNYIEYLLMNNKSVTDEFLKTYKQIFTYKNTTFINAFEKTIDNLQ